MTRLSEEIRCWLKDGSKIKVLIASPLPPPYSGYEKMTQMILKSKLSERFNLVHLNTSNRRSNTERGKFDLPNTFWSLRHFAKLIYLLILYRPNIAYVPLAQNKSGFLKYSSYILLSYIFKVRVISRLGGGDFDKFYIRSSVLMKLYIQAILKCPTIVIVRGKRLKKQFEGLVPKEKIRVVPIALETKDFDRNYHLKKDINIASDKIKILYVGHISKAKGALDLLRAVPFIVKETPKVEFLFAGNIIKKERNILHIHNPPNIEIELNHIIEKNKIRPYIKFLGIIDGERKIEFFLSTDVFVFPSYSEAFGFVILEAMAAGLPIVATPVGALPEVFKDKENVLFVDVGKPQMIAKKVLELIKSPSLRKSMGENNRKVVKEKFNLDKYSELMSNIFCEVSRKRS